MKSYSVFLGLGSNIGERHKFLQSAAEELKKLPDTKVVWTSSVYETDPVGKTDQSRFLNACTELTTILTPQELFEHVKMIERQLGRSSTEHWGPREIDIDILVYDGLVFENEQLKVPHPGLEGRRFVLVPLREIAPDLVHPVNGMTVEEMADSCNDGSRVVKTSYRILL